MFGDYSKLVLRDFEIKRADRKVPLGLMHLSLAQLRKDCIQICTRRTYERRKDEVALSGFFGVGYDRAAALEAISDCPIDRFKPLEYFLKGKTKDPNERVIELLAWLIDFDQRPFELGKIYEEPGATTQNEQNDTSSPEEFGGENQEQGSKATTHGEYETPRRVEKEVEIEEQELVVKLETNENQENAASPPMSFGAVKNASVITSIDSSITKKRASFKALLWPSALIVVLVIAFFLYRKDSCMYWAGDHFERIACDQVMNGVLVIPENSERIRNFKRITTPDTLTKKDINRVFYVKLEGELEYFTASGFHPVHLTRSLKPLSEYIYNTHIVPLKSGVANTAGSYDSLSANINDTTKRTVLPQ